jgi:hypothetical protein
MSGKRDTSQRPLSATPPPVDLPEAVADAHQTHFWLTDADVEVLDWWVFQLRRSGWRGVSRSACVRALLQAIRDRQINLQGITSEADFAAAIRRALDARPANEQ